MDQLPELALHHIFLHCDVDSITSLQISSPKFRDLILKYRYWYSKHKVAGLSIKKLVDGQRVIEVEVEDGGRNKRVVRKVTGTLKDAICSLNPKRLESYDHEELAKIHPAWWKNQKSIHLSEVTNYEQYTKYFDGCTNITIDSWKRKNISKILEHMKEKTLEIFRIISSDGRIECTNEDLQKIAELSNKLFILYLPNISSKSKLSNKAVLDMLQNGSFEDSANITISRIDGTRQEFKKCLEQRNLNYDSFDYTFHIELSADCKVVLMYESFVESRKGKKRAHGSQ